MNIPRVSVLLPVNQDDGFLVEALNSILAQSYKKFELLIIANNCSDELWNLIYDFQKRDERVKAYRLVLGGLCFALNFGLNQASGEYIARMDADDISYPDRLAKQISFMDKNLHISILGTQINYIDEYGDSKIEKSNILPCEPSDLRRTSYFKCPLYHPTVMFRKNEILKLGGYKFGFYGEDYELWLRCIQAGYQIANLEKILLDYRIHSLQLSSISNKKNIYISQMLKTFYKINHDSNYLLGIWVQSRIVQYLIVKTYKLRKHFSK